jgi:kynurenine formamidase
MPAVPRLDRIVDLSVAVDGSTLGPPAAGSPPVVLETARKGPGHWQSSRMSALLHTGSHVDAPLHVVADGEAIGDIGLDRVSGEAVVLDLHDVGSRERIDADRLAAVPADVREDDIVVVAVHLIKDNGELSSVTLDEQSKIELIEA